MSGIFEADVQTSEREADLFGDAPAAPGGATCQMAFTGQLRGRAHVAWKVYDSQGHQVPVLVLDLSHVGPGQHRVHAECPFSEATRPAYEALAKRLRAGQEITITTPLSGIRLHLPTAHISTDHPAPPQE